jgi:putative FmdB family regulatory protein
MPTYRYRCEKCGIFEVMQKITESSLSACPTCSSPVAREITGGLGFQLKGTGWYKDGYSSSAPSGISPSDSESSSSNATAAPATSTSSPAESAPAVKKETPQAA